MKRKLQSVFIALALLLGLGATLVPAPAVGAINVIDPGCTGNRKTKICNSKKDTVSPFAQKIVGRLIFALGIIAVIMIIVGGIRYTVSNGDPSKIKAAKDTILYSIDRFVVALLAYAIMAFVINWFK